jgi:hypothetical protein
MEYNIKMDVKVTVPKVVKLIYVARERSKCPIAWKMSIKM